VFIAANMVARHIPPGNAHMDIEKHPLRLHGSYGLDALISSPKRSLGNGDGVSDLWFALTRCFIGEKAYEGITSYPDDVTPVRINHFH